MDLLSLSDDQKLLYLSADMADSDELFEKAGYHCSLGWFDNRNGLPIRVAADKIWRKQAILFGYRVKHLSTLFQVQVHIRLVSDPRSCLRRHILWRLLVLYYHLVLRPSWTSSL